MPGKVLERFSLWRRGHTFYALSQPETHPEATSPLQVVSVGLPILRRVGRYLKPTSAALRLLSPWISRNRISLEAKQARQLLSAGQIEWSEPASEGYVLLEVGVTVLGCGLALPGRIKSQIPRREVQSLCLGNLREDIPEGRGAHEATSQAQEPWPLDTT